MTYKKCPFYSKDSGSGSLIYCNLEDYHNGPCVFRKEHKCPCVGEHPQTGKPHFCNKEHGHEGECFYTGEFFFVSKGCPCVGVFGLSSEKRQCSYSVNHKGPHCFNGPKQEKVPKNPTLSNEDRKKIPVYSGLLKLFPLAIAEIAKVSYNSMKQHGHTEIKWDRSIKKDPLDAMARHLLEAETLDTDGQRHLAKALWNGLAALQIKLEEECSSQK